jgi:hypothetical protein
MAMQNGFDGAVTDHDACSWLVKYVKTKHNLPNYDKAVKFSKNINYIDENNNITRRFGVHTRIRQRRRSERRDVFWCW